MDCLGDFVNPHKFRTDADFRYSSYLYVHFQKYYTASLLILWNNNIDTEKFIVFNTFDDVSC